MTDAMVISTGIVMAALFLAFYIRQSLEEFICKVRDIYKDEPMPDDVQRMVDKAIKWRNRL